MLNFLFFGFIGLELLLKFMFCLMIGLIVLVVILLSALWVFYLISMIIKILF